MPAGASTSDLGHGYSIHCSSSTAVIDFYVYGPGMDLVATVPIYMLYPHVLKYIAMGAMIGSVKG